VAEIKSALELALEKAERLGRASPEEMARSQYQDRGRQWAVQFLKEDLTGEELVKELTNLPAPSQDSVRTAIKEVFLRNVILPREETLDPREARALEGLLAVAHNPKAMAGLKVEVERFNQELLQVRHQVLQQLKARYGAGLGNMQRAMEAKTGQRVRLEAEQIPQFQEEWRQFQANLTQQFEPRLEALKGRMLQA